MATEATAEAMRALGAQLALLRETAGHTQASLARLLGYSRSTVANAETGQPAARHFWEKCEELLGGPLLGLFDEIRAAQHQRRLEVADTKRRQRARQAARWRPDLPGPPDSTAGHRHDGTTAEPPGMSGQEYLSSWALFAPELEPHLVDRTTDSDALVSLLTDAGPAAAGVVGLVGPGGFGKTTLATQACHDPRITEKYSTILWVETGEQCTPARIVQLVSDLCVHLGGERPTYSDADQAGFHLARVIADRRLLIVIDNVWSAVDLAPFLLGGPNAVRLVTTRNARVCPADALELRLGPMAASEMRELLHRTVPGLGLEDAVSLAELCSGWPLLASVVGSALEQDVSAGALPDRAAASAGEALDAIGPSAFDVWDSDQRKSAIGHAITASLRSLEEHVQIPGAQDLRQRYLSLAIFPAATPIPLSVLAAWWGEANDWTPNGVRQFCRVLGDRSLIDSYLADQDAVLLHDVFRAYLRQLIEPEWAALHRSLIDSYRPAAGVSWAALGVEHAYMWHQLPHHLHEAGLDDELGSLLASPAYVVKKAAQFGPESLAIDRVALARVDRPGTAPWPAAEILVVGSRLLHGLVSERDIAATILAAATRAGAGSSVTGPLRDMAGADGLNVLWATAASASGLGHTGAVTSVAEHGDTMVTGGEDGIVRIWDLGGSQPVRQRHGHTGWVYAVAISPDGQTIASAGDDSAIRLWHMNTGELVGMLPGHRRRIRSLSFTADARLVSGSEDGQICLWDTLRTRLIRAMQTPACPVWAVAVGATDTVIAAGGEDEFVRLYDACSGELVEEKAAHRDWVRSLAFAGDTLVTGSGDGSARVWKLIDKRLELLRTLDTGSPVRAVAVSADASLVVAAGQDATIRAYTSAGLAAEQALPTGIDWIRAVALREDGSVISGCEDGSVRIFDGQGLTLLAPGADTTWSAAFAKDQVLLGRANGTVELHGRADAQLAAIYPVGTGRVWSLAAAADIAAAACGDGSVRAWSLNGAWNLLLNDNEPRTWAVALNGAGTRLAASSKGGLVRVWDLPSGEQVWQHHAHAGRIRSMAFAERGDVLLTGGGEGVARLWAIPGGEQLAEYAHGTSWIRTVALDPSGTRAALGCGPGDIYIHDVGGDQHAAELHGHTGRVLMIGFTDDPDVVVSAAADGTVRAWSLSEQKQLAEIRVDASLLAAAPNARTDTVLAASASGNMAIQIPA